MHPQEQHCCHGKQSACIWHWQASPAEAAGGAALAALLGDMDAQAMEAEIVDATAEEDSSSLCEESHHVASADPAQETSIVPVRACTPPAACKQDSREFCGAPCQGVYGSRLHVHAGHGTLGAL